MSKVSDDEFYVGYEPAAPAGIGRRLRQTSTALALLVVAIALGLIQAQAPFDSARFEFQDYREYRGHIHRWPAPVLATGEGDYLLAGAGKQGAVIPQEIAEGQAVAIRGAKAQNGEYRLLELSPEPFKSLVESSRARSLTRHGVITLSGEIVDTKCYFGVMNPGRGKVHRDCAARCLSGGVAPGLLVRDATGAVRVFLLAAESGSWRNQLSGFAGEPVKVSGEVIRAGETWVLETSIERIQRE